jgi:hypothetical protein
MTKILMIKIKKKIIKKENSGKTCFFFLKFYFSFLNLLSGLFFVILGTEETMNITLDDIAAPMVDWGTLQKLKELGDIVNLLVS